MSMISGKDGEVRVDDVPVANITRWTFQTEAAGVSYASSATGGYRRRVPGARHGHGTFDFLLDRTDPTAGLVAAGGQVTLRLTVDSQRAYVVPAVIDSCRIETDIDSGDAASGTARFITDGPWSEPEWTDE
jgi:hypothetical protein